jgi:hypothetical protein
MFTKIVRSALTLFVLLTALGEVAPVQALATAREQIVRAAEALGGAQKILALRSFSYEGMGWNANLMQQMRPEAPLLLWMLPSYTRIIDLENQRAVTAFVRRPAFPAVFDNRASDTRLDGDLAWAMVTDGSGQKRSQRVASEQVSVRRNEMLHHPIAAVRAALAAEAKVALTGSSKQEQSVEVITARGDRFTLTLDKETGLPTAVSSLEDHVQLGNVMLTTRFSGYEYLQPIGLRFPSDN